MNELFRTLVMRVTVALCIIAHLLLCVPDKARADVVSSAGPSAVSSTVSFTGSSAGSYAGSSSVEPFIFQVLMPPHWFISEAVFAYQYEGRYYLPVVALSEGLEFFIEDFEVDRGYVSGFASSEDNKYVIDGTRKELIQAGKLQPLPDTAVLDPSLIDQEDVFVDMEFLSKIWPIDMHVDLSELSLIVEAEETLSFQRRKKREDFQKKAEARLAANAYRETFPVVDNPYKWIGRPAFDLQTTFNYDTIKKAGSGQNSISGFQQLAKFDADYSASIPYVDGKLQKPKSIRLNFSKDALKDEYLFIPAIKSIDFGDVSLSARKLIGLSTRGRGIALSNSKKTERQEFDLITIEGFGPPDWEIELYNNEQLVAFGVVNERGEYLFENVVLNFGNNRIKVVLFGPQGQIRETVESHNVTANMLSENEFEYYAGTLDTDRAFILLDNEPRIEPRGYTKRADVKYGLSNDLTGFASYTEFPVVDETSKYASAGLILSSPIGFLEMEAYKKFSGGHAVDFGFITKIADVSLNMHSAFYNGFESQSAGFGDAIKTFEGDLEAKTRLALPVLPAVDLTLNVKHTERKTGPENTEVKINQSFSVKGLRLTNNSTSNFREYVHQFSNGNFNATYRDHDWDFRGTGNYTLYPLAQLVSAQANVRYAPDDFQTALSLNHNFVDDSSSAALQVGYDFDDVLGSIDTRYTKGQGWNFIVRLSTSLNPYNLDDAYKLTTVTQRQSSPVRALVFFDENQNNKYDENEQPMEGIRLKYGSARSRTVSNKDGILIVPAPYNRLTNFKIDNTSLQNPYYISGIPGSAVVPRNGSIPLLMFPVVETGSIEGSVSRSSNGSPVQGMKLQLLAENGPRKGAVVRTTETAFDGYYLFEFVRPGTYTVRVDPSYRVYVPQKTANVASKDPFAFGVDLTLIDGGPEKEGHGRGQANEKEEAPTEETE